MGLDGNQDELGLAFEFSWQKCLSKGSLTPCGITLTNMMQVIARVAATGSTFSGTGGGKLIE